MSTLSELSEQVAGLSYEAKMISVQLFQWSKGLEKQCAVLATLTEGTRDPFAKNAQAIFRSAEIELLKAARALGQAASDGENWCASQTTPRLVYKMR